MFNRTNLTLSARTLSNRLNLGTRSLALVANVKNVGRTLRIRQTHHDVLRDGMVWYDVFPIMPMGRGIPSIPGSFSQQQRQPGCVTRQPGSMAEDVRVIPDPRPADLVGRPEPCVRVGVVGFLPASVAVSERSSTSCERSSGSRTEGKAPAKPGLKRAVRRAARATAATAIAAASTGK
jgi:hypothetical protein